MKHAYAILFCLLLFYSNFKSTAQSLALKPSIGIGALPADADSICDIPFYTSGDFETPGLRKSKYLNSFPPAKVICPL